MAQDWALLALPNPPFPGGDLPWFPYLAFTEANIKSYAYHQDGYPICWDPIDGAKPSRCTSFGPAGTEHTLWGQTATCKVGNLHYPLGAENVLMTHGCDMSGGHSGGPLYTSSPGFGNWVVGINIVGDPGCTVNPATCGDYPNYARRLDTSLTDFISNQRVQYP
jgi:hypothetical protein